jgi:NitT/TauT family transport system ATP-binding protein
MTTDAVAFKDVTKEFPSGDFGVLNLNFQINSGEIVAIVGQTGCGKSTAFNLLVGLTKPTDGEVLVEGFDPYSAFHEFRGKLGIVFQNDRLLPWRTAIENAATGLEVNGVPDKKRRQIAGKWLERLGLSGWEEKYPHELSGGMKQRVSISRAFAMNPNIILCDEAFSALDEITAIKLRNEFVDLVQENNKTGVFITHSISEAIEMANRILVFRKPGHVADEISVPKDMDVKAMDELRKGILKGMDIA